MSGTVGKQLIRYSETKKEAGARYQAKVALTIGLVLNTAFGPIVDALAYAFAPASLIAPIGALDIVWNILSAPYTLGEPLTKQRGASVAIIFAATFFSTFVADHTEVDYTIDLVYEYLLRWRTFAYFVFWLSWILFNLFYLLRYPQGSVIRGLSLGMTAGSIAGNLFCLKIVMELIKSAITQGSGDVFTEWIFYAILLCAVGFAVSNVTFMTKGLQEYEAIFMVTIYEGSQVTVNALSALVVLSEMDSRPAWRIICYVACLAAIIAGQALLVTGERIHKREAMIQELPPGTDSDLEETPGCCDGCEEDDEDDEDYEDTTLTESSVSPLQPVQLYHPPAHHQLLLPVQQSPAHHQLLLPVQPSTTLTPIK